MPEKQVIFFVRPYKELVTIILFYVTVIGVGGIIWLTRSPMVPQRRSHMHTEYARETSNFFVQPYKELVTIILFYVTVIGVGGIIWLTRSPMVPQRRSHVHTQHVDLGEMA